MPQGQMTAQSDDVENELSVINNYSNFETQDSHGPPGRYLKKESLLTFTVDGERALLDLSAKTTEISFACPSGSEYSYHRLH